MARKPREKEKEHRREKKVVGWRSRRPPHLFQNVQGAEGNTGARTAPFLQMENLASIAAKRGTQQIGAIPKMPRRAGKRRRKKGRRRKARGGRREEGRRSKEKREVRRRSPSECPGDIPGHLLQRR